MKEEKYGFTVWVPTIRESSYRRFMRMAETCKEYKSVHDDEKTR
jgi:hypothetical protein